MRQRLQQAALELITERGYDQTTAGMIAARAGVTERTFFRHFSDKREMFFDGEEELRDLLVRAVAGVAPRTRPLPALRAAFHEAVPLLERNRPVTEPRAKLLADVPALKERSLAKTAALVAALTEALCARGVDPPAAALCAQIGMDTFAAAAHRWMQHPATPLHEQLDATFNDLRLAAAALK
ncbi:TetR/AcrR family transcriptional regulator [Actinoplanes sp. RD1]|uniref:TetR/AcrR family transcriptional regulator n=1 Tax=Actinoplanes sp. RD1 TaxID=3064538 RepID=UPI0027429B6E|nr:TetR/AcrR family transcriptional regulator [Actinoplanes sp. RD1]